MRADQHRTRTVALGFSLIEALVATVLVLVVVLIAYGLLDYSKRAYLTQSDIANAQMSGRIALTLLTRDLQNAGYSPLGLALTPIAPAEANRLRVQFDQDGDGRVLDSTGVVLASELTDTSTWQFIDPDLDGVFQLQKGIDLNTNWSFNDSAAETIATYLDEVVPVDSDGDGGGDPFFTYLPTVAAVTRVRIVFGIRLTPAGNRMTSRHVIPFATEVALRNRAPSSAAALGL